MLNFERQQWESGCRLLAGVDEAGRGPLAGPVVAAAVMFTPEFLAIESSRSLAELNDSKKLTDRQRRHFHDLLRNDDRIAIGVGISTVAEIDRHNIRQATAIAMCRALNNLPCAAEHALVDGLPVSGLPCASTAIVKGDGLSLSIAAASVIAKFTRDEMMRQLALEYPDYGFDNHKGYGTNAHIQALLLHGPTPQHRRSFRPVREIEAIRKHQSITASHVEKNPRNPGRSATRRAIRQSLLGFMG